MSPIEHELLVQALSLMGLGIGTFGYLLLVRRRCHARHQASAAASSGLQGLVRVMLGGYVPE
jgi:hypothetical protein